MPFTESSHPLPLSTIFGKCFKIYTLAKCNNIANTSNYLYSVCRKNRQITMIQIRNTDN